jgi:hypothetical protein
MATQDDGISRDSRSTGYTQLGIIILLSIALYNVVELTFVIFATFKRRSGLYFWSFVVATWGIAPYAVGFMMKSLGSELNWVYVSLIVVGWCTMVTGQSVVLYSRLHIVVRSRTRMRLVLGMIVTNAIICHIPIVVMVYGANSSNPEPFVAPYSIYEKVQVTIFFLQEIIISGMYIWETVKLMRIQSGIQASERTSNTRSLMTHLILVNVIIVILDITILALEYAGMYDVQTAYKALVYSAKLKMEFSILNKLVEIIQGASTGGGSSVYARTKRGGGGQKGGDAGGVKMDTFDGERGRRVTANGGVGGVGYQTYVRSAVADDDRIMSPTGGNVLMTTEIVVKRDKAELQDGDSADDKSGIDVITEASNSGARLKKSGASSSSSSEIQFANMGY